MVVLEIRVILSKNSCFGTICNVSQELQDGRCSTGLVVGSSLFDALLQGMSKMNSRLYKEQLREFWITSFDIQEVIAFSVTTSVMWTKTLEKENPTSTCVYISLNLI